MTKVTNESSKKDKVWIGFDLGGTKMLSIVYDDEFKALGRDRKKTKGADGSEAGLKRIKATINEALEQADVKKERIAGIGIGCPGMLDLEKGVLRNAPNLGWTSVPLKKELEKTFGCPVEVCNDVDAGVYGEYRFGAGKGARCVAGIFPGTGIGGGCVYDGNILRGSNVTCMEIGHIPMQPEGPLDGCGREGTLESIASRLAIAAQATQAAYRGQAPYLMSQVRTEVSEIRSGVLARAVDHGDEAISLIIKKAARHIGQATVTLIHLIAPDVIILGGGLVEAMPELFLDSVSSTVKDTVLPSFHETYKIVVAELGDDAGVQGAAAWARHQIEDR